MNHVSEIQLKYKPAQQPENLPIVNGSRVAFDIFNSVWDHDTIAYSESFCVLFLNRARKVLGYRFVTSGGRHSCMVDISQVFAIALKANASAIILAHNHPAGTLLASRDDVRLTERLIQGAELLGLKVLDHIILGAAGGFISVIEDENL